MEKRYQVFISSTYEDLKEERMSIIKALLELDCIPSGMELFTAGNDDQWSVIKQVIRDCDYYIVIIGGCYGSRSAATGKSYTQMEYEYAVELGKPIAGFIHKNPNDIPAGKTESTPDGKALLEEFKGSVKKKMVQFWTDPNDLAAVVSRSISQLKKTKPAIGWIRADKVMNESAAEEILALRKQIDEMENNLDRLNENGPKGTDRFAQGSETFTFHFEYVSFPDPDDNVRIRTAAEFRTTWRAILWGLLPFLRHGYTNSHLEDEINSFVGRNVDSEEIPTGTARIDVTKDDLITVRLQLIALGLIGENEENSSAWYLTQYGKQKIVLLRAIKAGEDAL